MGEDEVSPEAEFLWEWNQRMVSPSFTRILSLMLYPLFLHRFCLRQWMAGVVLLIINWTCVFLIYYEDQPIYSLIAVAIMIYEWVTIGKRTNAYNQALKTDLKRKWNVI